MCVCACVLSFAAFDQGAGLVCLQLAIIGAQTAPHHGAATSVLGWHNYPFMFVCISGASSDALQGADKHIIWPHAGPCRCPHLYELVTSGFAVEDADVDLVTVGSSRWPATSGVNVQLKSGIFKVNRFVWPQPARMNERDMR